MKRSTARSFITAFSYLIAFVLWTFAISYVDVQPIGPNGSCVGFSGINEFFHRLTGSNMLIYTITDWLGLVPIAFCFGFAILGLVQWIRRKHILNVDHSILILGLYYILVMGVYILFEYVVINRRPVLINGYLEASYPSSTTLLVLSVMPTSMMQLYSRIKQSMLRRCVLIVIAVFVAFMVIGRFVSGVHWFTDIVGGVLLSAGLVMLYKAACKLVIKEPS